MAFGVVAEIPGPLFYGTVGVGYAFEKVLKLGWIFLLHGVFLFSFTIRQIAVYIHSVRALHTCVFV